MNGPTADTLGPMAMTEDQMARSRCRQYHEDPTVQKANRVIRGMNRKAHEAAATRGEVLEDDPYPADDPWFDPKRYDEAKALCAECPLDVFEACREEGLRLSRKMNVGVWGGTTPHERRAIPRVVRRNPAAESAA